MHEHAFARFGSSRLLVRAILVALLLFLPASGAWGQSSANMTLSESAPANADGDASNTVTVGDVLTYTITASNDGDVPLTNVQINDPLLTPNNATCASVAVGNTCVLIGTHLVSSTDAANGQIFDNPQGSANELTDPADTGFLTPVATAGGAAMVVGVTLNDYVDVDASNTNSVGDQLHVVVTAINGGSVPLTNVQVSDPQTVPNSAICATVAVGASCVLTGTYTLTASDLVTPITFTGSATSTEVPGPVSFTSEANVSNGGSIDLFSILIVSGNNQGGAPGSTLPIPLKVRLLGAAGAPVAGEVIRFQVASGSGQVSSVLVTTDAFGEASTQMVLGPTPGPVAVHVVPNQSNAPSVLFTENVLGLAPVTSLTIVSGDSQTLVANTPSAPLVVALKDSSNLPVVGATVSWTTSAGTLASTSTVTDSNGQSSNSVTTTQAGAVQVGASTALAPSVVTFNLNASLATISGLSPEQEAVAVTLDNACPALADLSSPTPEQADLLARCQEIFAAAGLNSSATANALDELLTKTAEAQATAASVAVGAQIQNINARLITLRHGGKGSGAAGLTLTGSGGSIPLFSLLQSLADTDAQPAGDTFTRWSLFASGNIGRGEAKANSASPAYDYDIDGITVGIDYRQRDNWVFGAALGYSRQDTTLAADHGDSAMNGWSLSAYSTYSFKDLWYLDSVVIVGHNSFDLNRRIHYTLPTVGGGAATIDQVANGQPGGGAASAALTFGGDFQSQAWAFSPYGQMIYARMDFDAYQETMQAGPGSGLALAVDARRITSLTGILGARLSYTYSADWGVFAPLASLELDHELKSDAKAITARFLYDPTQTPFSVAGAPIDSNYMRLGLGMTFVFTHGRSGFFLYQRTLARNGQSQDNLSLGMRIEF